MIRDPILFRLRLQLAIAGIAVVQIAVVLAALARLPS